MRIFLLLLILYIQSASWAQDGRGREAQKLFIKIEEGLNNGSVDKFSNYFSSKNYLSLSSGLNGYYSSNQSYYVLKDYFSVFQPISFKFTNIVSDSNNPFAAGNLKFISNGIRGSARVFITLHHVENQWRISQITIN